MRNSPRLFAIITSLLVSAPALAQDPDTAYLAIWNQAKNTPLACESEYQSKINNIEDHRFWRTFARYSVIGFGAASGVLLWKGLSDAEVQDSLVTSPLSPTFFGLIGGFFGAKFYDMFDREDEIRMAYHALKFSGVPFAGLRKSDSNDRYLTPIDFVAAGVNRRRTRLKLKPVDYEEVRKEILQRTETTQDCPYTPQGKLKLTGIRQLTKAMKQKLDH